MTDYEYSYTPTNMCFAGEHKTDFASLDMKTMKAMISAANPGDVKKVASAWGALHEQLVGGHGVLHQFTKAVDEVLKHWEGEAAERFKAEADKIAKKIRDGAQYANYTKMALNNAAAALDEIKPQVESMEVPSDLESGVDWVRDLGSRSDENLKKQLAAGVSTQQALDNNRGELSAGKEAQLEMAIKMEQLAAAYNAQSRAMGSWQRKSRIRDGDDYPGEPGGVPPVPVAVGGSPSSPSPQGQGPLRPTAKGPGVDANMASPETGIHGGTNTGTLSPQSPSLSQVDSGLDGISGGTKTVPSTVPSHPGGGGSPISSAPATGTSGGSPGMGLVPGGLANGLGKAPAGGQGATPVGRMGRMPIGGGLPQNGAGKAKPGTTGRGPLARVPGGVVGASDKSAARNQGGSGLHRSRGGTQAGGRGAVAGRGMVGVPANRAANKEEEERRGKRPDYLVEDEQTWTPEREVAPKVVE